jgi:hypothetical protein
VDVDVVEVDLVEVAPAFVLRRRPDLRDRALRLGRSVISGRPPRPSRRTNAKVTNASPASTTRPATNFIIFRTCLRLPPQLSGCAWVHGESVPDDSLAGRLQSVPGKGQRPPTPKPATRSPRHRSHAPGTLPAGGSPSMTDAQSAATPARRPRRSKQAILTWVAVYPSLTLVLAVLNPLMESWPLWLRTLLVTVLLVPVVVWVILPVLTRVVGDWLYR